MNKKTRKIITKANMSIKKNLKMRHLKTRFKKKTIEMILRLDMQKMDGLIINKFTKKAFQASKFLKKLIEILICKQLKFFSQMIQKSIIKNNDSFL